MDDDRRLNNRDGTGCPPNVQAMEYLQLQASLYTRLDEVS